MAKQKNWRKVRDWKAEWLAMGFSEDEAEIMLTGCTYNQAIERQGKVYHVGYIGFPQALTADHAIRLYELSFPYDGEGVTAQNGINLLPL